MKSVLTWGFLGKNNKLKSCFSASFCFFKWIRNIYCYMYFAYWYLGHLSQCFYAYLSMPAQTQCHLNFVSEFGWVGNSIRKYNAWVIGTPIFVCKNIKPTYAKISICYFTYITVHFMFFHASDKQLSKKETLVRLSR